MKILLNDMAAKVKISMVLMYFRMLRNMTDIAVSSAKVRMAIRMLN